VAADTVVLERLNFLRNELTYLSSEQTQVRSLTEYLANLRLRKAVERSLQLSIEVCLDIGRRLIALNEFRNPETNQDIFQVLADQGIVPKELLPTLFDMSRFRNLIVHDYTRVDDAIVYSILTTRLGDFNAFANAIASYLQD
jgi:uncharacterized protein YutE (UPF0331/DUF86 family)